MFLSFRIVIITSSILHLNQSHWYGKSACVFIEFYSDCIKVPLMKKMIDVKLLTSDEIEWVNAYHSQCRDIIGKELEKQNKKDVLEWLNRETTPISV